MQLAAAIPIVLTPEQETMLGSQVAGAISEMNYATLPILPAALTRSSTKYLVALGGQVRDFKSVTTRRESK